MLWFEPKFLQKTEGEQPPFKRLRLPTFLQDTIIIFYAYIGMFYGKIS